MTLVNGYVCRNCTDEELAKRGVDPLHPKSGNAAQGASATGSPNAANATNSAKAANATNGANAVDGKAGEGKPGDAKSAALGVNQPNASGPVGTALNLLG
jgi:hypothetical protein